MEFLVVLYESLNPLLLLGIGYGIVLWVCFIFWVAKDISNRTLNAGLQMLSILLVVFFSAPGFFVYLLIRPEKTLLEKDFEELFYVLREKGIM